MKRALVNCAGIYQTIDYWMIQMFTAAIASKADKPHLEFILTREGNVVAEANALQLHSLCSEICGCFCKHPQLTRPAFGASN